MDVPHRPPDNASFDDLYKPVDVPKAETAGQPPRAHVEALQDNIPPSNRRASTPDITAPHERRARVHPADTSEYLGATALTETTTPDSFDEAENPFDLPGAEGVAFDPDVESAKSFEGASSWEGLNDWAEDFRPASLPSTLQDGSMRHFHARIEPASGAADSEQWQLTLKQGYDETGVRFVGELESAANCMAAFEAGARFVLGKLRGKGVDLESPPIRIVTDPQLPESEASMAATRKELLINGSALEDASAIPPDEVLVYPAAESGEPAGLVATIEEFFFLGGVEEAHHYFYENTHPSTPPYPRDVPHIEYHTSDQEYHALRWKIMAARQTDMPAATIAALEHTYTEATLLRRQLRG